MLLYYIFVLKKYYFYYLFKTLKKNNFELNFVFLNVF